MENETDVFKGLQKPDLFKLFAAQLRKDFEGAGESLHLNETLPDDLNELIDLISEQLRRSGTNIPALMYRIDISEMQVRDASMKNPGQDLVLTIAGLIIKRILQKVVIRQKFSGK